MLLGGGYGGVYYAFKSSDSSFQQFILYLSIILKIMLLSPNKPIIHIHLHV